MQRCGAVRSQGCSRVYRSVRGRTQNLRSALVGAPCVADEQRVSSQEKPRLVAARAIDYRQTYAIWSMARGVNHADADVAEIEHIAIVERPKLESRRGAGVQTILGTNGFGQRAPARDVIGVHVRIDDVQDLQAQRTRKGAVRLKVGARVDDRADSAAASAEEIRCAGFVRMQDLTEDHVACPWITAIRAGLCVSRIHHCASAADASKSTARATKLPLGLSRLAARPMAMPPSA